jgi:hypothetical protein
VVKSLALIGSGPVGLVRTQNLQVFLKRKGHLIVVAFIGGGLAGARASGPASYFRNRSCLKGRPLLFCPETARYYHRLFAAT